MTGLPSKIHVLAELERCGIEYSWAGKESVRCLCPFHDDHSPSCTIDVEQRKFKCWTAACGAKGDFVTFLAGALKSTRAVVLVDLAKRYDLEDGKIINPETVERYHSQIWTAEPLMRALHERGVTDDMIRRHRLGEHDKRITIPVRNENGLTVNIRRYLPGAPGKDKMRNTRGYGKRPRLYPVEQLQYDEVLVVGGEMKAIVAAAELNEHGVGCVTATSGEGNWHPTLTELLRGKSRLWVCMDVDDAGDAAANALCAQLHSATPWLGKVVLPLDTDKYPKGDVNDYVASEDGRLWPLLETCERWEPTVPVEETPSEPEVVTLQAASHAGYANKRVRLRAVVSAMDTAPYAIPRDVVVNCDRSQKECAVCPVFASTSTEYTVPCESAAVIEMVSAQRGVQREALMRGLRVPVSCKSVDFKVETYYNVEDTRVSPQLEIADRAVERVMQPALCIGDGLELNESYEMVGRMHPHPRTQQATLLFSAYKPTQDALSTYTPSGLEELDVFRPDEWTADGVRARLHDLYSDFEANVTRIFRRRELHLMIDLAFHSPLLLTFDERVVKGWVEVLVVGDSAQGKTETFTGLMRHYRLGEKVECKNASVAGLLGGLQQMGNRWFVSWGVIPTHDKRLVCLEELKGASVEVISKLTDMRSSGVAEIPKIEKRRTHARTRLVALSNPRSDRPMSAYNFGVEAIRELIGGLEDIRRFDAALVVSKSDVPAAVVNKLQQDRPSVPHVYETDACRALLLWTWTRDPREVEFVDGATKAVMRHATDLCGEFTDSVPLVDRGSMRLKLARLAAACAARTFSTSEDRLRLHVRPCHVQFVTEFLRKHYSSPTFGYKDYTDAVRLTEAVVDPEAVKRKINDTPFPVDFVKQMLHKTHIELTDVQDWTTCDRQTAMSIVSLFVRKHALVRHRGAYHKTPPFIQLLRAMLENDEAVERPDFMQEF